MLKIADECRPKQTPLGRAAWIEVQCKTITRQTLSEHIESNCYKEAMSIESIHVLVETHGGIAEAFVNFTIIRILIITIRFSSSKYTSECFMQEITD